MMVIIMVINYFINRANILIDKYWKYKLLYLNLKTFNIKK